jgi:hypothetical protein
MSFLAASSPFNLRSQVVLLSRLFTVITSQIDSAIQQKVRYFKPRIHKAMDLGEVMSQLDSRPLVDCSRMVSNPFTRVSLFVRCFRLWLWIVKMLLSCY